ncbi:hypothetical protein MKZ38_003746 [Zalerion maritima]|uniref:Ankyrin n=1 Tax=Zalerion maritima TaxID=339359 RepID=A0AAD5RMG1_9PEZI|nr:hypothetical protein MKZ38_003746 [Zalerion maritima]
MSRDSFTDLLSAAILSIDDILDQDTDTEGSRESLPTLGEAIVRLPTIRDTLRAIGKAQHVAVGYSQLPDANAALSNCKARAEVLRDIILSQAGNPEETSGRLERYWNSIKHVAKSNRAGALVQAMIDDIKPLADSRNVTIPPRKYPKKTVRWNDAEEEARTRLEHFRSHLDEFETKPASLKLLQWLCCSLRPLSLDELRWALALDTSSREESVKDVPRKMGFIRNDHALERRIETLSYGLVEIKRHEKNTVAQFIHPSVSDYFKYLGLAQLDAHASSPAMALARAHRRLARECIHCFSIMASPEDIPELPLYSYASMYWAVHIKETEERGLWLDTIVEDLKLPSSKTFEILTHGLRRYKNGQLDILHTLMERRIIRTISLALPSLVEHGVDIDVRDELGRTPLALAARSGHDELVSALRLSGADPDICDGLGVSPLGHAAKLGKETVLADLIDPRPPLHPVWSERDCPPEKQQEEEIKGEEEEESPSQLPHNCLPRPPVEIPQIDPDRAEGSSRTPLSVAASCGNVKILKRLLGTGRVDPNARDVNGESPLSLAAQNGHADIVSLLLGLDVVDPNARDIFGRTPLALAAKYGHTSAVSILIGSEGVDLNGRDSRGRTPLWEAIRENSPEVFHVLVQANGVDVNVVDGEGEPLLVYAARANRHRMVRQLLEIDGIDKNKQDGQGRSTVHNAAKSGDIATLDHLLCHPDIAVDDEDSFGKTPLMLAASRGEVKVVERLLETGEVDVNRLDHEDQTAITLALRCGNVIAARALFDTGQVDLSSRTDDGSTPLAHAVRCKGAEDLVREMMMDPACHVDAADFSHGWTPLIHAATTRDSALMVSTLVDSGGANLRQTDIHMRTPLSWAASNGHKETVLSLLARCDNVEVNRPDFLGRTPLSWAVSTGNMEAAFCLANHQGVDIDGKDVMGRSPLFWAIYCGQVGIAELLLSTRRVDVCPRDQNGLTPFDLIDDLELRSTLEKTVMDWEDRIDGLCFSREPWIPYPSEHGVGDDEFDGADVETSVDNGGSISELNLDGNDK